jgi:hypothetical protein
MLSREKMREELVPAHRGEYPPAIMAAVFVLPLTEALAIAVAWSRVRTGTFSAIKSRDLPLVSVGICVTESFQSPN